ncbi:hypothetical protein CAGGBEG34_220019 [Candidatus Glomeribacter gigasporarum BEG34]|uniref:Restriction endonuclease type II EcoRII C-terminal domain-containing protein n=1 Tax=Candidatus Glomeribacter gigasporarum BEG34 TaxID=1070319 RepID=G2J924_9BURK|nr:hypothetical protein [Candidatus Glomeribacter gigasporarum]CCD29271.1 hypothetical protein CAGGBEG34_220019 [Candidatus Glomeribacter gigasporarum BEG34]
MLQKHRAISEEMNQNPWENAYWFARMLINGDKYGAIGRQSKFLTEVCIALQQIVEGPAQSKDIKFELSKNIIQNLFEKRFSRKTAKTERIKLFLEDLFVKLKDICDIKVFILTVQNILIPINVALESIPNDDKIYTEEVAKAYLDRLGNDALSTVVQLWDNAGVIGCLNAERGCIVQGFAHLRQSIRHMSEHESDTVLTAYVQEFERRLGQKRKGRAGGSLEDVTSFLFKYFNIKAENKPDHFQADIEIDKWILRRDKWLIGISCKRTLRERWKQVSSAHHDVLNKFKIWQVWHLITYDEDLSDDKLTLLGIQRHVFYLPDNSRRLESARNHLGMKDYVRPMSQFIHDIKKEQGT